MQELDITAQVLVTSATLFVWVRAMRERRLRAPLREHAPPVAPPGVRAPSPRHQST